MQTKIAVLGRTGWEFVPVTVEDTWASKYSTTDEAETVALAMAYAHQGIRAYRVAFGEAQRITGIQLTTSMPAGSLPLFNEQVLPSTDLSCYICLCDDGNPPKCVCTPC